MIKVNPINGYFGTTEPLGDGEASAGRSKFCARADHVHPADGTKASASDVEAIQEKIASLAGALFVYKATVAVDDWQTVEGESPSVAASVYVEGIEAESVIQILPVGITIAAYETLAITASVEETNTLILSKATAPESEFVINVLYTKPSVFGVQAVPEPEEP